MDPLTLVVLLVAGYFAYSSGILAQYGIGPSGVASQGGPPVISVAPNTSAIQGSEQTAQATTTGVATGLSLIPVAGPAIGAAFKALSSVLLAASAARAKAATTENAAVAAGLPGWDTAVGQIANAYNSGQITAPQAQTLFAQTLANFWAEVTGKIQAGRNGCNYGANCPPSANPSSDQSTAITGANTYCSGSIGAACCVGCADLALSVSNLTWAVGYAAKTGQSQAAFIQTVYASKYGGANRAAYNVVLTPPGATALLPSQY
jgi:hypothetical protein